MTQPLSAHYREAAIGLAVRFTGLDVLRARISVAKTTADTQDAVSCFSDLHKGLPIWRVQFVGGSLPSGSRGFPDKYPEQRTFIVLLDESMRHFLGVRCEFGGNKSDLGPEPLQDSTRRQLCSSGVSYTSPPDVPPKLTFVDAVFASGGGDPRKAKEIYGSYVTYAALNETPHPVWLVCSRGMPSVPTIGLPPNVPEIPIKCICSLVDAMTGFLYCTQSIAMFDAASQPQD